MDKTDASATLDAVSAAVSKAGHDIPREAYLALDASNLASPGALVAALEGEGIAAVLLHGLNENFSELLQREIGISTETKAPYLLIRATRPHQAKPVYHIVEGPVSVEVSGSGLEMAKEENTEVEGAAPPNQGIEEETPMQASEVASDEETFAKAVAQVWPETATATSGAQPIQQTWVYTKIYTYNPSGSKTNGYTPPSDQTFMVVATYTINGVLSQVQSGDFQYLVAEASVWSDPQGMKNNSDSKKGWGNNFLDVKTTLPSVAVFNQASPKNTNNAQEVTTSVSFEVGLSPDGGSGGTTWSKSTTKVIKDWLIVLERLNYWNYAQNSPFKGQKFTSFPKSAVHSGIAGSKLKSWPDLTKKVMDQATMLVGSITPATSNKVTVTFELECGSMFFYLQDYWVYWEGVCWWNSISRTENFTVDMSTVLAK